jgi:hypothetical protein
LGIASVHPTQIAARHASPLKAAAWADPGPGGSTVIQLIPNMYLQANPIDQKIGTTEFQTDL